MCKTGEIIFNKKPAQDGVPIVNAVANLLKMLDQPATLRELGTISEDEYDQLRKKAVEDANK